MNVTTRALYYPDETEYIAGLAPRTRQGHRQLGGGSLPLLRVGYNILDIRCQAEIDQIGNFPRDSPPTTAAAHLPGFPHPPTTATTRGWQEMMTNQESNKEFLDRVAKIFPDKANDKNIVSCSDGRNRASQALEALDEAGFVIIVGLRGGYTMWNRTWDAKMRRRNLPGVFQEEWQHSADGCGVHATGASFQNQDAFQYADWKDETSGSTGPVKSAAMKYFKTFEVGSPRRIDDEAARPDRQRVEGGGGCLARVAARERITCIFVIISRRILHCGAPVINRIVTNLSSPCAVLIARLILTSTHTKCEVTLIRNAAVADH